MKSLLIKKNGVLHRAAACLIAALLCSQVAQAQTALPDGIEGAQPSSQVSKKMRLVKKTTIKRSQLPAGKLTSAGKSSPKGKISSLSAVDGGCLPDSDSQQPCGGEDEFEVLQYAFVFDSILNGPGSNDVATIEILKRVEITGKRTIYVDAETDWGQIQLLFEELNNRSFGSIGIGESDADEVKDEAERIKKEPKKLGKVLINTPKPTTGLATLGAEKLTKIYPNAIHQDKALLQLSDGKCAEYERYDPAGNQPENWYLSNANASCNW